MTQLGFFTNDRVWKAFDLPDADVRLLENFLNGQTADVILSKLMSEIEWRQDSIRMFGKTHALPRLHQWFGSGMAYTWSGIRMNSTPWCPALLDIRNRIEQETGSRFNSVLANLYRTGEDMVSWHADDEAELGPNPTIASVSLGVDRDFAMRRMDREHPTEKITLGHGSLLVMEGPTQKYWEHSLPRRKGVTEPRINLTFRWMHNESGREDSD